MNVVASSCWLGYFASSKVADAVAGAKEEKVKYFWKEK